MLSVLMMMVFTPIYMLIFRRFGLKAKSIKSKVVTATLLVMCMSAQVIITILGTKYLHI